MRKAFKSVLVDLACMYVPGLLWLKESVLMFSVFPLFAAVGLVDMVGLGSGFALPIILLIATLVIGISLRHKFGMIAAIVWPTVIVIGAFIGVRHWAHEFAKGIFAK